MTVSEVIAAGRRLVSDSVAPYRWTDAVMQGFVIQAIREAIRMRPSVMYVSGISTTYTEPSVLTQNVGLVTSAEDALAYYLAYKCLSEDAENSVNLSLAGMNYQEFKTRIKTA